MTTSIAITTIAPMKKRLRAEMKARLASIAPQDVLERTRAACRSLIDLPEYRDARVIMLYLPIPQEVDPAQVALHAWGQGKTVLAPKVDWSQRHMLAVQIHSMDDGVVRGKYGVPQPPPDGPVYPVEEIDLVIVPALAYDRTGGRLGRGGGFYDRFLSGLDVTAVTCGLAFTEQLVDQLPADRHDRPVDILVTDKEVLRFGPGERDARAN